MILFKDDWDGKPVTIDVSTTNRTWVRMAKMYRDHFHLDNWAFPLALIDGGLVGIDPYAEDLSDNIKLRIKHECRINPWYFYREILRIPAKAGVGANKFRADRGTIATLWLYHNHIDTTNTQLRQTGKTIKIEAILAWLIAPGAFNTTALYGTLNRKKQADTVRAIKEKLDLLPGYIYSAIYGKDFDNTTGVSNVSRKNYIEFAVGQKDPNIANESGRGFSLANRIWDEAAEMINAHISIAASSGSSNAVVEEAREKGEPYGTVYACTAGSLDRTEGSYYYNLSKSGMPWTELLLDCSDEDDLKATIGANSKDHLAPLVDVTLTWEQLGLSRERFDEIVARSKRESNGDMDKVKRECYSIWSRGGVTNPLTKDQIETIYNSEMEPVRVEKTKDRFIIRWYVTKRELEKVIKDSKVILAIDSSNAVNNDACSLSILDMATLEVLGRMDTSMANLTTYINFVAETLVSIDNSVLIIENKSSGQSIIDGCTLKLHSLGIDPFERIFNNVYQNVEKYRKQFNEIRSTPLRRRDKYFYDRYKGLFGFFTTHRLRQDLYDSTLTSGVKLGGSVIRDSTLSGQLRVLEDRNGRIDHPIGGHDDAAISWLLAVWFCVSGRNYKYYNIPTRLPLSKTMRTDDGGFDEESFSKQQEINYLLEVLPKLEDEYKIHYGTVYGARIKDKLTSVNDKVEFLGGTPVNLEQLFDSLQ